MRRDVIKILFLAAAVFEYYCIVELLLK